MKYIDTNVARQRILSLIKNNMIINIEGLEIEITDGVIKDGDMYVAERNIGKELLTAKFVDFANRWIIPKEIAYVYNLSECKKVVKIIEH